MHAHLIEEHKTIVAKDSNDGMVMTEGQTMLLALIQCISQLCALPSVRQNKEDVLA